MGNENGKPDMGMVPRSGPTTPAFQSEETLGDTILLTPPQRRVRFTLQDGSIVGPGLDEEFVLVHTPSVDTEFHRLLPYRKATHYGCQWNPDLWLTVDPDSKHPFVKKILSRYKREMHDRVRLVWKYLQTSPRYPHFNDLVFIDDTHFGFNIHQYGMFPVWYRGVVKFNNTVVCEMIEPSGTPLYVPLH